MAKVANAAVKAAKKSAKKVINSKGKAKKKETKKALKKSKALYNDEEKRVISNLRSKKSYLKKNMNILLSSLEDVEGKITLYDLRPIMSDSLAASFAGTGDNPMEAGYFEDEHSDDYYHRDFREWMLENADDEQMEELMDLHARLGWSKYIIDIHPRERTGGKFDDEDVMSINDKIDDYAKRIAQIDKNIKKVRSHAQERKNLSIAQELAKKNGYENAESLIEAMDRGHVILKKLSKPEQAAVEFVKEQFSKAIVGAVKNYGNLSDKNFELAKSVINASVMSNPMEGLRVGIRDMAVNKVIEKYGNDAGDMASSMIDLVTGKGSVGSLGVSIFSGIVNKTGLNKQLMQERSQELIDAGKSDFDTENMKQLGASVMVDIAESVIVAGGNIYAAVPIALKKILFDTAGAAVRSATHEEKPAKKKSTSAKTKMSDEDVVNKFMV